MKGNRLSHRDERIINGTSNTTYGEPHGPATHGSERTDSEDEHYEGLNKAWNNTKRRKNQIKKTQRNIKWKRWGG